jgi:hypothetical protein
MSVGAIYRSRLESEMGEYGEVGLMMFLLYFGREKIYDYASEDEQS